MFAIGVDLGGTKIGVGLVDPKGHVLQRIKLSTDVKGGAKAILEQIVFGIKEILKNFNGTPAGIGIGVPGQIEKETGHVICAQNIGWQHVPLRDYLNNIFKVPIFITNDVGAAAWTEWTYGAGKGCNDLICIFVGTGIGGGIISNGKLVEGCSFTAGEVGHMILDMNGPPCTCGSKGCLEAFSGGWAIAKRAQEYLKSHPKEGHDLLKQVEGNIESITAKIVIEAANSNNELAKRWIQISLNALIIGCSNLVNIINPCRLILGGGVMKGLAKEFPSIEKGIKKMALPTAAKSLQVLSSQLNDDAGIIGSASLAFHADY